MYISKSEGANFGLSCLSDIQSRGVKDILIACTDNLTGFRMPLEVFFLKQLSRLVLFTQNRNSIKYVISKNQKKFMKDLELVYRAVSKGTSREMELDNLELK